MNTVAAYYVGNVEEADYTWRALVEFSHGNLLVLALLILAAISVLGLSKIGVATMDAIADHLSHRRLVNELKKIDRDGLV